MDTFSDDLGAARRAAAYARLVQRLPGSRGEERWLLLMAAHVVGQLQLRLHCDSHVRMLHQALAERDAAEAAGQLLRLALVPLGHVLRRLPHGNVGRATVNAFRPMVPPPAVRHWVRWAISSEIGPEGAPAPLGQLSKQ